MFKMLNILSFFPETESSKQSNCLKNGVFTVFDGWISVYGITDIVKTSAYLVGKPKLMFIQGTQLTKVSK